MQCVIVFLFVTAMAPANMLEYYDAPAPRRTLQRFLRSKANRSRRSWNETARHDTPLEKFFVDDATYWDIISNDA